jgi:hypothetical protein
MELLKYWVPLAVSVGALLLQLYVASKIAPLDRKIAILCEAIASLKLSDEKQWLAITETVKEISFLKGRSKRNE